MALSDVMLGLQTWTDYVSTADQTRALQSLSAEQRTAVVSSQRDTQFAIEASSQAIAAASTQGLEWVAGGIAKLNTDFNLLMGETIWLLQLQDAHLKSILQTLQAPLDTSAKELRRRAERAYVNGWYDEALADFIESGKRNYQDFAVHRSIGNIYLFHRNEVEKAVEYFGKAAKYARAIDTIQASEAHYYCGIALAILKKLSDAEQELDASTELNPYFAEAFYTTAAVSGVQHKVDTAVRKLRVAIQQDPRYFARAEQDLAFDGVRPAIQELLNVFALSALGEARSRFDEATQALRGATSWRYAGSYQSLVANVRSTISRAGEMLKRGSYNDYLQAEQLLRGALEFTKEVVGLDPAHAAAIRLEETAAKLEEEHRDVMRHCGTFLPEKTVPMSPSTFRWLLYLLPWLVGSVFSKGFGFVTILMWPIFLAISTIWFSDVEPGSNDYDMFVGFRNGAFIGIGACVAIWVLFREIPMQALEQAKEENSVKRQRLAKSEGELTRAKASAAGARMTLDEARRRLEARLIG